MALKTRTINLHEERDRLDERREELAYEEAELQVELEDLYRNTPDGEEVDEAEIQRLQNAIRETAQQGQQIDDRRAGIQWAIQEWGVDEGDGVRTDGNGQGIDGDATDEARKRLESENTDRVNDETDSQDSSEGPPAGSQSVGGDSSSNQNQSTASSDPTSTSNSSSDGELTLTLQGLSAGDHAKVVDLSQASQDQMGYSQMQMSGQGEARNVFVAGGIESAPFINTQWSEWSLQKKTGVVSGFSVRFREWVESIVQELTEPPELVGNAYRERVASIAEEIREDRDRDEASRTTPTE